MNACEGAMFAQGGTVGHAAVAALVARGIRGRPVLDRFTGNDVQSQWVLLNDGR